MKRGSETSIRMKYSAFIQSSTKKPRLHRQSQAILSNSRSTSRYYNYALPSPRTNERSKVLSSSTQLFGKIEGSPQDQQKLCSSGRIEQLLKQAKHILLNSKSPNKLNRTKSQEVYHQDSGQLAERSKNSIGQIKDQLARFSRKTKLQAAGSPSKNYINQNKSPQRLNQATQKCKQLCSDLKKKLLKETVSTTTTERRFGQELSIKQFSLGKKLGKGKFSKVHLAQHIKTGLIVALKIIKKETIKKQSFADQLVRQLKIQAYFNHVNIVRLYGFFADQTNFYLIQEYCPGGELYDIFKIKSKLKDEQWTPIMKGICEGLCALHLHDVIHRDLKPQNIMLAMGIPKIGDFGWAVYTPNDKRQTFCGTPLYISPELLLGGSYDKQVDIWALGIMMYEFLTGRIPFKLDQNINLLKIVNSKIEFPTNLPEKSVNLMKMILQKDPQTRIGIMDILEHPYLQNSLTVSSCHNPVKGSR